MMYIHFCKNCNRLHILNGHKQICPACDGPLSELKMPYTDYFHMSLEDRNILIKKCQDEMTLKSLSTTYRMFKYSKWYKEQNEILQK